MRALSENFLNDFKNPALLHPILERVKQDDTLMLAIRGNYINIYYRGGNIFNIKELGGAHYQASFDKQYNKSGKTIPSLPAVIADQHDAKAWVDAFPVLKDVMDNFFSLHSKPEREFQQLVARENNCSTISNETEYFIADIEFADSGLGARFDMLAVRWLASQRKNGSSCRAALVEMKYGDDALDGSAGMQKHLEDIDALISDGTRYKDLLEMMATQFNQLDQLGLLNFNRSSNGTKVQLKADTRPEVIFVIANHNKRSTKLKTILDNPEIDKYGKSDRFDLKFFVASFAGYGMHEGCMHSLADFRKLL